MGTLDAIAKSMSAFTEEPCDTEDAESFLSLLEDYGCTVVQKTDTAIAKLRRE